MYYEINEEAARRGHEAYSMFDYVEGSTTAEYRRMVDKAAEICERQAKKYPDQSDKLDALLDRYSKGMAQYYNDESRINGMCPSILISGGSNFPVGKKQKQNAAADRNHERYTALQELLHKMQTIGTGGIQSSDPGATDKLRAKLEKLEELQETMKQANAYYRKNKTLDGCPGLSERDIASIKGNWARGWYVDTPFPSYSLSNNNAEIHRLRERIASLEKVKSAPAVAPVELENGITVEEDAETMRIKIIFPGKPDEATREILKSHGFRWAPSVSAWQRQLNANGKYAAKQVLAQLGAQG